MYMYMYMYVYVHVHVIHCIILYVHVHVYIHVIHCTYMYMYMHGLGSCGSQYIHVHVHEYCAHIHVMHVHCILCMKRTDRQTQLTLRQCEREGNIIESLPEVGHSLVPPRRRAPHVHHVPYLGQAQLPLLLGAPPHKVPVLDDGGQLQLLLLPLVSLDTVHVGADYHHWRARGTGLQRRREAEGKEGGREGRRDRERRGREDVSEKERSRKEREKKARYK